MRTVWVVGTSGSGKSRLARRLAAVLGARYVELDTINHQPNWTELPRDQFRDRVTEAVASEAWVIDANYASVVGELILERADTVVWFDLPRRVVMYQLTRRTLRRMITCCNGRAGRKNRKQAAHGYGNHVHVCDDAPMTAVRAAATAKLDSIMLYRILALRVDIFVVEQNCPYRELDGRDLEPSARQLWVEREDDVAATLRLLREPDGSARIGRVATAVPARGHGLAGELIARALDLAGPVDVVLDAQSHLTGYYARYGFEPDGDQFIEDRIAHTPMRRHSPA